MNHSQIAAGLRMIADGIEDLADSNVVPLQVAAEEPTTEAVVGCYLEPTTEAVVGCYLEPTTEAVVGCYLERHDVIIGDEKVEHPIPTADELRDEIKPVIIRAVAKDKTKLVALLKTFKAENLSQVDDKNLVDFLSLVTKIAG